ncbi:MAG TPA: polysaccharide biosynthesis/export family protein [Terriglobia bacterium]|nr:polysaccharide biosynthesis/export family protein [Terriglobia bacterium]
MKDFSRGVAAFLITVALALLATWTAQSLAQDAERVAPIPNLSETQSKPSVPKAESSIPANSEISAGPDYQIGPEDVLQITVFGVPDLNETVRVANDGTIALPLLGRISASGLTADQLRDKLEKALGKNLLQNPQVGVFVSQFQARPVSIVGAVEKPGLYQITGPRNLIEMLSLAGGLAKRSTAAPGKLVYVTRPSGFKDLKVVPGMRQLSEDKIAIDLKDLLYTQANGLNIQIEPHDIIAVSKADVIYVAGSGVRKPGGFLLEDRDSVTVIQALAMAEGLAPDAAKRRARIIHTRPDGSYVDIPLNLEKIINQKAPDPQLAANDILYVPVSRGKAVAKKTAETIVQTVSGFVIFHP